MILIQLGIVCWSLLCLGICHVIGSTDEKLGYK